MTTLEFMRNELEKHRQNCERLILNDAPAEEVEFARMKLMCCRDVCNVLKEVIEKCQS